MSRFATIGVFCLLEKSTQAHHVPPAAGVPTLCRYALHGLFSTRLDCSIERALNIAHDGLGSQAANDAVEVLEIPDLHLQHHVGEIGGAAHHAQIVDVAVGLADHLSD